MLTDDQLHPSLELRIDGKIVSASGVEPPDFVFDKIPIGESRTAQVYVMAMLQDELTVSDPQLSDPATARQVRCENRTGRCEGAAEQRGKTGRAHFRHCQGGAADRSISWSGCR